MKIDVTWQTSLTTVARVCDAGQHFKVVRTQSRWRCDCLAPGNSCRHVLEVEREIAGR
jgi:hypothetical protein